MALGEKAPHRNRVLARVSPQRLGRISTPNARYLDLPLEGAGRLPVCFRLLYKRNELESGLQSLIFEFKALGARIHSLFRSLTRWIALLCKFKTAHRRQAPSVLRVHRSTNRFEQFRGAEGLWEKRKGCGQIRPPSRHEENRNLFVLVADGSRERVAIHYRHVDIGEHERDRLLLMSNNSQTPFSVVR